MLHRFATYEQAALFVAMKRDEGYHAEILHEHASGLWGPLAMGGVVASVSDLAADEEDEVPEAEPRPSWLPIELSLTVAYAVLSVLGILLLAMVLALLRYLSDYPLPAMIGFAKLAMVFAFFVALVSAVGWACSRWVHQIWNGQHRLHQMASGIHIMLAVILILFTTMVGELLLLIVWTILFGFNA